MRRIIAILGFVLSFSLWAQSNLSPPSLGSSLPGSNQGQEKSAQAQENIGNLPQIKLSSKISPKEIYQNEVFDYIVELSWKQGAGICPLEFNVPTPPQAEGIKAIGAEIETEDMIEKQDKFAKRIYRFKFLAEKQGRIILSPADFEYRCLGSGSWQKLSSPALPVEILPARFKFSEFARSWKFRLLLVVIFAFGLGGWMVVYFRKRSKPAPVPEPVELSPEERAKNRLKEADQFRIAGRYADYLIGLELTLREYFETKFSLKRPSRERILSEVKKHFSADLAEPLERFFHLSDRVKFAGYEPTSSELDSAYQVVFRIIEIGKGKETGGEK